MRDVLAIVWSPRKIEEALVSHEELGFKTAFICGTSEHDGHRMAWELAHEYQPARVYLLSYDDQIVTRAQADRVLELQAQTGDIVSGWQLLGMDSPYASAVRPSWGADRMLATVGNCFYTAEEVRAGPELLETIYFPYALTAIPRKAMLEVPLRVLSQVVTGGHPWPSRDGLPYDKGMCGDWCHSTDLVKAGYKLWTARDVQVNHLAPIHGVPVYPFYTHIDEPGVYWDWRPR